jgi:multidrug transporter EmrE-like cation transporter
LSRVRVACSSSQSDSRPEKKQSDKSNYARAELFRGKSGSVSFNGLTHQLVEESKLVSAPFQEEKGSFLWVLAPVVLISSLILPQFFLSGIIEATFKNDTVAEIVTSFCFETVFYAGLAIFLSVTDRVQRPYLDFSSKRWGLITGLRGYLTSAFLTMGLKVVVPVFAVYMTWPALGIDALIAVLPFLVGCAVQRVFEARLERRGSSCWPIVPIVFEVNLYSDFDHFGLKFVCPSSCGP